jgi:hypothetical protein
MSGKSPSELIPLGVREEKNCWALLSHPEGNHSYLMRNIKPERTSFSAKKIMIT